MFACIHGRPADHALLVECACAFSPLVEETAAGTVTLDLRGLERLFGSAEEVAGAIRGHASKLGLEVSVGVAQNPDAAVHAARGLGGINVIPPGEEAGVLRGLPLELLDAPPEMQEVFALWGLRCFGDLGDLPEAGVSERLGPEGGRLRKLARGLWERPLRPADPVVGFQESMELEHPVALLEPLGFILSRLLHDLCARLGAWGLGIQELRLRLKLEDGAEHARTLRLPVPTRDHRACWKLLQLDLDAHRPGAPIVEVRLEAEPGRARGIQRGLFVPAAPEPEKLEVTLARIAGLVGADNVGAAELVDTHRPGAFRRKPFLPPERRTGKDACPHLALRVFRPALRATVETSGGRPVRVTSRGVRGEVIARAGPWRSSGDWWAPDAWARDEWDVALSDGVLYRIYWDRQCGAWFVEGSYD